MFSKQEVVKAVFQFARKRYGTNVSIGKETSFKDLDFTQYDVLYIVLACEETFGVNFDNTEVATLHNVRAVIDAMFKKLRAMGALERKKPVKLQDGLPVETTENPAEPEDEECETPADEIPEEEDSKEEIDNLASQIPQVDSALSVCSPTMQNKAIKAALDNKAGLVGQVVEEREHDSEETVEKLEDELDNVPEADGESPEEGK